MSTVDRRTILAGGAAATATALLPFPASAHESVLAQVRRLRDRWAEHRQDIRDTLFLDRPSAAADPIAPTAEAMGHGLGALSIVKELEEVPYAEQAHPAMQALIGEAVEALGGAVVRCRELMEAYLDGGDDEADREAHLKAALRGVRLGLSDWKASAGRVRSLEQGLLEIEHEEDPGALLRRVRRTTARIRRAEALAKRFAEGPGSGVFEVQDAAVRAEVLEARARWTAAGEAEAAPVADGQRRGADTGLLTLGAILIGLGFILGLLVVLVGVCAVACGALPGVFVILLGLGVGALLVWGGMRLVRKGEGQSLPDEEYGDPDEPAYLGPRREVALHRVPVVGGDDWVETPAERGGERLLVVRAEGLVRAPGHWLADADGNAVAAGEGALVPGAPLGAVVGRVGDDTFFLGAEGVVPEGPPGRLCLAVNRLASGGERLKGHFVARVAVLEPERG